MPPEFTPLSVILFFAVVGFLFVLTVMGLARILQNNQVPNFSAVLYQVVLGMIAWIGLLMFLSLKGVFHRMDVFPPRIMFAVVATMGFIAILAVNRRFGQTLRTINPAWLIWPQVFRILVEIVLWLNYENGDTPIQMTFEGLNFDILAGISAPIIAWLAYGQGRQRHGLALVWNFVGLALLLNILTIAVLSTPAVGVLEPENTFIGYFPFALLPGFVAPYAMLLHVVSIRQLIILRREQKRNSAE
ncbi:MAG: hypothetical protein AAF998_00440 [Bacteroidota bacterium]